MLSGRRIVVVMPAYKATRTLESTFSQVPHDLVDEVILTDDASGDGTPQLARRLGITTIEHESNRGYGGNQKTCYIEALKRGADVVVMLHPDYQYEPRLVAAMASMITSGVYDVVLGSRILGGTTLSGGMPLWKYVSNRILTLLQNLLLGTKLSEFHTGFRAYSREALESLPLLANSDDFLFDNQLIVQSVARKLRLGEISCPTRYQADSSSIGFGASARYGAGVLGVSLQYVAWRWGLATPAFLAGRPGDMLTASTAGRNSGS